MGWLEQVEVVPLGVEFVWNGESLGRGNLILRRELGLDMLKCGVGMGEGMEARENVWIGQASRGVMICVRQTPVRKGETWALSTGDRPEVVNTGNKMSPSNLWALAEEEG